MEHTQVIFSATIVSPLFNVVYEEGFHTAVDVFLIWWPTVFDDQIFQFLFRQIQTECPTENLSVFFRLRPPFREFFFSWVEFWFWIYLDFFNSSIEVWTCDFTWCYSFSPLRVKRHCHFFIQWVLREVVVKCSCDGSFFDACLSMTDCFIRWVFHVEVEISSEWDFLRHCEDNLVALIDRHWVREFNILVFDFEVDVFTSSVTVSALLEVHVDVRVFDSNCSAFFWNFSWRFFDSWCFFCCVSCCFGCRCFSVCSRCFSSWCYGFWGWCLRSCFCCGLCRRYRFCDGRYVFGCRLCRSDRCHCLSCWLRICHLISVGVWCHDCK